MAENNVKHVIIKLYVFLFSSVFITTLIVLTYSFHCTLNDANSTEL
jgi:hypothetical protein